MNENNKKIKRNERKLIAFLSAIVVLSIFEILDYNDKIQNHFQRYLSINLGNGQCEWSVPVPYTKDVETATLLVAFPGSGKRLGWRILEGLTGYVTGDDWNHSEEGLNTLTMKSSYPHPEGSWPWMNQTIDQVILMVRNPRSALPSYHTMKYELDFSDGWVKSHMRKNFTYTERPPVAEWEQWRDEHFSTEIDRWVWYIDFWLNEGLRRNDGFGNPFQDPNCARDDVNCFPKAIIQFEKIVHDNHTVRMEEMELIGDVLDASPSISVIEMEARPCVFDEVMKRKHTYNPNRDWKGPLPSEKKFTYQQLNVMKSQIYMLKDKYSLPQFADVSVARTLVSILDMYIQEISDEYDREYELQNNTTRT